MTIKITHHTKYQYSSPVFAEPHHLYFHPSHRHYFQLKDFHIAIDPVPSGLAFRIDAENNPYHQCWFNGEISSLDIRVEMTLETFDLNPFNFLVEDKSKRDHSAALMLYLQTVDVKAEAVDWAKKLHGLAGSNLVTFLSYLSGEIHAEWEHNERYAENVLTPDVCFDRKKGSCRDLSWMMIQLLRKLDIPARFVSGYSFNPDLKVGHELHAWVEAWVPGAGWIGLDPSSGLLATDHYIPTCTSFSPENTLPVQGVYRGEAGSELSFEVEIREI